MMAWLGRVWLRFTGYASTWRGVISIYLATLVVLGLYLIFVEPLKVFLAPEIYLDLREDGYDLAEAMAFYEGLGQLGRAFYMRSTIFDTIWPLMVALAGFLFSRQTFRRWWLIGLFAAGPVAFGVLDLFENIGLMAMNWWYPDLSESLVAYSNALTLAKLSTLYVAIAAFFGLPLVALGFRSMGRS